MATYYISSAGNNTNNGTTTATPWLTLAKAQSTASTGDTILLRRGDRWKEQFTVPADTFSIGAYGAAATFDDDGYCTNAPVIDGGEYVTGWSTYAGGTTDSYLTDNFTGTSGANLETSTLETGSGTWAPAFGFAAGSLLISSDGMARRSGSATVAQYTNTAIPATASYFVQAVVQVKSLLSPIDSAQVLAHVNPSGQGDTNFLYAAMFYSGTTSILRIGQFDHNTNLFHEVVAPPTWTAGNSYTLRIEVDSATSTMVTKVDGVTYDTYDFSGTFMGTFKNSQGYVGIRLGSGSAPVGADATGMQMTSIDAGPLNAGGTPVNTYQASLSSDPQIVIINGDYAFQGTGINSLEDQQWFQQGTKIYVRNDPGTPSNSAVIRGSRDGAIAGGTHTNVTIQDIAFEYTRDRAIVFASGSNVTIQRVYGQLSCGANGQNGCLSFGGNTSLLIDSCFIRDCGTDGVFFSSTCTNHVITNNHLGPFYGANADGVQDNGAGTGTYTGNILIGSGVSPKGLLILLGDTYTITNNYFEGGRNFHIATFGDHIEVADNVFYNCQAEVPGTGGAFEIVDNVATDTTDYQVHHNLFIDCNPAINCWSAGVANRAAMLFYNNTIINILVAPTQWQINFQEAISGSFKNNIVYDFTATGRALQMKTVISGSSWSSDYNTLGPENTAYLTVNATAYNTLAAYQAATLRDSHSITSDPRILNIDGDIQDGESFEVRYDSPAAAAGVLIDGYATTRAQGALGAHAAPTPIAVNVTHTPATTDDGDIAQIRVTFRIDATTTRWHQAPGELTDPDILTFQYRIGTGSITTLTYPTSPAISKEATGTYRLDLDIEDPGTWHYRAAATGDYQGAAEGTFTVETSNF